jgi:hypothetical protein
MWFEAQYAPVAQIILRNIRSPLSGRLCYRSAFTSQQLPHDVHIARARVNVEPKAEVSWLRDV